MKPPPTLHADLAGAIREVLERADQPLNLAKLRSQLHGPFKVPAKLKDALVALLDSEIREGRIHAWPASSSKSGPRYWARDSRTWAAPVIIEAADREPVSLSKLVGTVAKRYGRKPAEALITELIESGELIRVPLFGGSKAKLSSRIADEIAFKAELDAAQKIIEAGYRRLGTSAPGGPLPYGRGSEAVGASASDRELADNRNPAADQIPTADRIPSGHRAPEDDRSMSRDSQGADVAIDAQILNTLASLEPRKGLLVTAPRLYRALTPQVAKSEIDAALLRLQQQRRVILHRHSSPQSLTEDERQSLIADGAGDYYVGACWRVQED
jgi:hypothetical protein